MYKLNTTANDDTISARVAPLRHNVTIVVQLVMIVAIMVVGLLPTAQPAQAAKTAQAAPQSCRAFLDQFATWSRQGGGLRVKMTWLNPKYAAYAEGRMVYTPATGRKPAMFHSDTLQYFSDRRGQGDPFDPNGIDELGVDINHVTGLITFTMYSWGNGQNSVAPICSNGYMYHVANDVVFALHISKT